MFTPSKASQQMFDAHTTGYTVVKTNRGMLEWVQCDFSHFLFEMVLIVASLKYNDALFCSRVHEHLEKSHVY